MSKCKTARARARQRCRPNTAALGWLRIAPLGSRSSLRCFKRPGRAAYVLGRLRGRNRPLLPPTHLAALTCPSTLCVHQLATRGTANTARVPPCRPCRPCCMRQPAARRCWMRSPGEARTEGWQGAAWAYMRACRVGPRGRRAVRCRELAQTAASARLHWPALFAVRPAWK